MQKNIFRTIIFFISFFVLALPSVTYANTFTKTQIQGIDFQYVSYYIQSDLYKLKVGISREASTLEDLSQDYNGITAINGVFFCPADYPHCNNFDHTINERFVDGQDLSFYPDTGERGVFGWDSEGNPFLHQTSKINPDFRDKIYEGLGNFPILLSNGVNMLGHYHDIGFIDSKMKANSQRHFICSTQDNEHIIFGRSGATSLDTLVPALQELGCWNALNLDAGNSSHFMYNNRKLVSGQRDIIDGFVIERVGLDTHILDEKLDGVIKIFKARYQTKTTKATNTEIQSLQSYIAKLRHDMYVQRSIDIFDTDGNIIGYQIQADDIPSLTRLYLLNGLERRLGELRK